MIVRSLDGVIGSAHDVSGLGWNSRRMLTARDGMGYTMTDTVIFAGAEMTLEYKSHLEACYCISGRGEIEDLATGQVHAIAPGVIYALNAHDRHTLRAFDEMRLVCTFTPALTGEEIHGKGY